MERAGWKLGVILVAVLVGVTVLALTAGAPVPLGDLWSQNESKKAAARLIFFVLRPPRVVAALLVGASLALSGSALQATFRNPLAEPYLLGISAGGALGATLAAALQLPVVAGFESGVILAWGGALGAALVVAKMGQGGDNSRLLLCGVAVSAFLSALMSLVITLSNRLELAQQANFWLLGGLTRASWPQNAVLGATFSVGGVILGLSARDLNALQAGTDEAQALGVDIKSLHRRLLVASSLLAASSVAAAGLIGFVGLLAPHIVRLLGGRDAKILLPGAALFGASLLCGCDLLAHSIGGAIEVPVGLITALLGVPFFLHLARKS